MGQVRKRVPLAEYEVADIRREVDKQATPLAVSLLLWLLANPDTSRTDGSRTGENW